MVGVAVCLAAYGFTMVAAALLKTLHRGYSFLLFVPGAKVPMHTIV